MRALRAAAVLALGASLGCMTIDTRRDPSYHGPWVYSGVRKDGALLDSVHEPNLGQEVGALLFWSTFLAMDAPFSFLADTALLPITIPEDRKLDADKAREAQVNSERPSPIEPTPGEDALATARRLFATCAELLHDQDPHLSDCYSIDAQVELAGGGSLRGSEYKQAVRAGIERNASAGRYVEWRNPTFSADGERVRIDATRASSVDPPRTAITLVVGPCADGGWRIVSETSIGWAAR
ncbi:MAG TPA: YceK/YidQ family lipoprotein [Myxococcota bacterium]|nr:YceK/YidQ family lipoprotein [Myxococcota bacterium]